MNMRVWIFAAGVAGALMMAAPATAATSATPPPPAPAPIVFFDIAAPELKKQAAFYRAVFGWSSDASGALSVPVTAPLHGVLRVESDANGPVAERVLYVGVPDVAKALADITANGGTALSPRMVIPGVVILGLFKDPAGNRMGVVELGPDGAPKVPPAK